MLKKQNETAPSHGEATAAQVAARPPCAPPKARSATPAPEAAPAPSFTPESDEAAANQEPVFVPTSAPFHIPHCDESAFVPQSEFRIPRYAAPPTSDFRLPT